MKTPAASTYTVRLVVSDGQEQTLTIEASSELDAKNRASCFNTLKLSGQMVTYYVNGKEVRANR